MTKRLYTVYTNYIKIFFIVVVHFTIQFLILYPTDYINTILWNKGVCRKCKIGRYVSYFSPDRFFNNQFICSNCKNRFRSTKPRYTISDEEYKIVMRNNKINKII